MVSFADKSTFQSYAVWLGTKSTSSLVLLVKVQAFVLCFRLKPFWPLSKIFLLFWAHWCALKKDHPSTSLSVGQFHLRWAAQKPDENYRVIWMFEKGCISFISSQRQVSLTLCHHVNLCDTVVVHACMLNHFSCVRLYVTLWAVASQAPLSMGFSRQE